MNNKTKTYLVGLTFLASTWAGLQTGTNLGEIESELEQVPAYAESKRLGSLISRLDNAVRALNYKSSGLQYSYGPDGKWRNRYKHGRDPDAKDARKSIAEVRSELGRLPDLDDRLREVYDSLPDENNVKDYNGSRVGESTFKPHQDKIASVRKELSALADDSMDDVPEDLKSGKTRNVIGLAGSIFLGIASLLYGLVSLNKYKRKK